jgi:hypothetical protein
MLSWWNILSVASLGLASLVSAVTSVIEVAPNQGCILLVGYDVTTKDAGSLAELRVQIKTTYSVCGYGSSLATDGKTHKVVKKDSNEGLIWVAYGGMVPFNNEDVLFENFPICVVGPDELVANGNRANARPGGANVDFDWGSYLW